jgi:hypothetical protein
VNNLSQPFIFRVLGYWLDFLLGYSASGHSLGGKDGGEDESGIMDG